jgi:hypothetical protein
MSDSIMSSLDWSGLYAATLHPRRLAPMLSSGGTREIVLQPTCK